MNKIRIVTNPYEIYDFITNIERITSIKSWGIDGITKLKVSAVLTTDGSTFWNYFDE
jgi:hypothetical protein